MPGVMPKMEVWQRSTVAGMVPPASIMVVSRVAFVHRRYFVEASNTRDAHISSRAQALKVWRRPWHLTLTLSLYSLKMNCGDLSSL